MSSICCAGMGCESCVHGAVIAAPAAAQLDADLPPLPSDEELMKLARKYKRGPNEARGTNDFLFTRTRFLRMMAEALTRVAQ